MRPGPKPEDRFSPDVDININKVCLKTSFCGFFFFILFFVGVGGGSFLRLKIQCGHRSKAQSVASNCEGVNGAIQYQVQPQCFTEILS